MAVLGLGYLDLQAALPAGLYDMTSLRVLDLEQNCLPGLSPAVSRLTNLQVGIAGAEPCGRGGCVGSVRAAEVASCRTAGGIAMEAGRWRE